MSFQLDNRVWADEFHAYASNSDLDDLDDYEITELPIIPPVPSLEPLHSRLDLSYSRETSYHG
jgi:hypothetical protein